MSQASQEISTMHMTGYDLRAREFVKFVIAIYLLVKNICRSFQSGESQTLDSSKERKKKKKKPVCFDCKGQRCLKVF